MGRHRGRKVGGGVELGGPHAQQYDNLIIQVHLVRCRLRIGDGDGAELLPS